MPAPPSVACSLHPCHPWLASIDEAGTPRKGSETVSLMSAVAKNGPLAWIEIGLNAGTYEESLTSPAEFQSQNAPIPMLIGEAETSRHAELFGSAVTALVAYPPQARM